MPCGQTRCRVTGAGPHEAPTNSAESRKERAPLPVRCLPLRPLRLCGSLGMGIPSSGGKMVRSASQFRGSADVNHQGAFLTSQSILRQLASRTLQSRGSYLRGRHGGRSLQLCHRPRETQRAKKSSRKGRVPGGQRTLIFSGSDWSKIHRLARASDPGSIRAATNLYAKRAARLPCPRRALRGPQEHRPAFPDADPSTWELRNLNRRGSQIRDVMCNS